MKGMCLTNLNTLGPRTCFLDPNLYLIGTISRGTRFSRMLPLTQNRIAINILHPIYWSTTTKMLTET
ncbi:hypothetical protein MtrunA17_Chr2g0276991 [Medicago truncatula]|uniref:Uncharacterized protein n=1 Tax=Medicago truncatula TaxID=3880 RepID=A0A396J0A2_MEDTR|nr:hypothetical protein MtrunA17_Chr2g0276991 [Medicago truncatula]